MRTRPKTRRSSTLGMYPAVAPAPKLQQWHQHPSSKAHTATSGSGTLQRHQHPSSKAHTATSGSGTMQRHQHASSKAHRATSGSGTSTQAPKRTQPHLAAAPCSGTSTQDQKRQQAPLPVLEVRTPIALAIWGRRDVQCLCAYA